jgi:mRNA-degrading endonuclease toxin of MazEF toxin-antitoxin module
VGIEQGDIYWVLAKDLDIAGHEQDKSRPYVIVSRTEVNNQGRNVVGVPLSTKLGKACAHRILIPVALIVKNPKSTRPISTSVALTDHIRVLDSSRLEQPKMACLSTTAIAGLEAGLAFLFDIH